MLARTDGKHGQEQTVMEEEKGAEIRGAGLLAVMRSKEKGMNDNSFSHE